MSNNIPTYTLQSWNDQDDAEVNIYLINHKIDKPKSAIHVPFRGNYFGLSLCVRGSAEIVINLENYQIKADHLIVLSPQHIRQFNYISEDYKTISVFFTEEFFSTYNHISPYKFEFFENSSSHVLQLSGDELDNIRSTFDFLKLKFESDSQHREQILASLLNAFLYEISNIESMHEASGKTQNRGQLLLSSFKKLLYEYCPQERSVGFYADHLFVTPKHLSEICKNITGKTAGQWIAEIVILEAKILLQKPELNIAQVSESLHFTDPSTFGKFFKNISGQSPMAYRQKLG